MRTDINKTQYIVISVVLAVVVAVFGVGLFGFDTLSAVRAYVEGEGLWAKNQKRACYELVQYLRTRDQMRYENYLNSLRVPLGYQKARNEVENDNFDRKKVFSALLEAGHHPDDFASMIRLYKRFNNSGHLHRAVEQWKTGDRLIAELQELGESLHQRILADTMTQADFNENIRRIDNLQARLEAAEKSFSYEMGSVSRWVVKTLTTIMFVVTIIGAIICIQMLFFVGKIMAKLKQYSADLEHTARTEEQIKEELVLERDKLQKALAEIETLQGIIPICMHCKKIKDDKGYWNQVELYIQRHSQAQFSHGLCPDCVEKYYSDLFKE